MSSPYSSSATLGRSTLSQRLTDYYELCKPRVVLLIVFTAMVGMFLATPGMVPIDALLFGTLGIGLMAASAAAVILIFSSAFPVSIDNSSATSTPSGAPDTLILIGPSNPPLRFAWTTNSALSPIDTLSISAALKLKSGAACSKTNR